MKNLSSLRVEYYTTQDQKRMGGWSKYCEFYEITSEDGKVLAQVNEEDGTIITQDEYFQRDYGNIVIPITLLEVHDKYILFEVHNCHNSVEKLYYKSKKKVNYVPSECDYTFEEDGSNE